MRIEVIVRNRRYRCLESLCPRKTFTERTDQLPARARVTTRLAEQLLTACRAEPRAVSRVAHEAGLSRPTVMRLLTGAVDLSTGVVRRHVRRLGIDEHRFRTVRYLRDPDSHAVTRSSRGRSGSPTWTPARCSMSSAAAAASPSRPGSRHGRVGGAAGYAWWRST